MVNWINDMKQLFIVAACLSLVLVGNGWAQPLQISGLSPENETLNPYMGADPTFTQSPDGQHVLYFAGPTRDSLFRLYSTSADGNRAPVELTSEETKGALKYTISPDSKYVVFVTITGYYSVPITGGTPVKLNTEFIGDGHAFITPDSKNVIIPNYTEVWSIPIKGGEIIDLIAGRTNGSYALSNISFSPDSAHVVFPFFEEIQGEEPEGNYFKSRLYKAPIRGDAPPEDLINSEEDIESITDIRFSPDGERVVFQHYTINDFHLALSSVSINGGSVTKLSGKPTGDGGAILLGISEDSAKVYYLFGDEIRSINRIYSLGIDEAFSNASELVDVGQNSILRTMVLSSRSEVIFTSDNEANGLRRVLVKDLANPSLPPKVVANLTSDQRLPVLRVNANETFAAVTSSVMNPTTGLYDHKLTSIDLAQKTSKTVLETQSSNDSMVPGIPWAIFVDESGKNIVYSNGGNVASGGEFGIRAVDVDTGEERLLSDEAINGPIIFNYYVTHDMKRILYVAGDGDGHDETLVANLYVVDIGEAASSSNDETCFPILAKNKNAALICL